MQAAGRRARNDDETKTMTTRLLVLGLGSRKGAACNRAYIRAWGVEWKLHAGVAGEVSGSSS
jgi:hypothetical protein